MHPLKIYRCQSDGKLVFEDEFERHCGHRLVIATNGTFIEWITVKIKSFRGRISRRKHFQA